MKILVKPPGSPRSTGELARMLLMSELADEAKHQGLMDEMKPLALSGPADIVSKTSDAPLSKAKDPIVPFSVETPLVSKRCE